MKLSRSEAVANWYSRYFPDAYILALILTILAMVMAMAFTPTTPIEVLGHWFEGIPSLFTFAFQLMFTYAAALVIVDTPVVQRFIRAVSRIVKTPMSAYMWTGILGAVTSFIGWYFGPIVTAIFARSVAKQIQGIDYRLISAIAYSSFTISLTGISGTIPLTVATEGNITEILGGVIGLEQTTFSTLNLVSVAAIVITTTLIYYFIAKNKKEIVTFQDLAIEGYQETAVTAAVEEKPKTFAEKVNSFRPLLWLIGAAGLIYLVYLFINQGLNALNLNTVAIIALVGGMLLQKDAMTYAKSFASNLVGTASIGMQFPLYGGIAGILVGSGVAATFTEYMVSFATAATYPIITFLFTGILNLFIPSAGAQFQATAIFLIPAAETLGVEIPRAVMAITYGDLWTNMIQPFWALLYFPILAQGTRLTVRDFLGYCLPILVAIGIIWILGLLFLPL
ncbi:short-chain fatty acids transporter [Bacillus horti]|uniref:Short-chain fatty acids transporter n=2 Tax=Caldalkalibacillus horti TaxID=77523 RepID=A0ABT9VZG5_9BACI|nr:short-chain fatty acids transporter [Bacillus horti]